MGDCDVIFPWLLLKKANDGFKAIECLRTAGCRAGVVSITYVVCVNAARSVLAYDGYDCAPATAFELFDKCCAGRFDAKVRELFGTVCRYKYESEFNPLFGLADAELESLISGVRAFYDDVEEYLRGK